MGAARPRRDARLRAVPEADPALLVEDTVEFPVQVNGKVRSRITVPPSPTTDAVRAAALADPRLKELLGGAEPRKVIVVPGRTINIVVLSALAEVPLDISSLLRRPRNVLVP